MMDYIFIPDLFAAIAAKVSAVFTSRAQDPFPVYFDYGHYNEVVKNLTQKDNSISQKNTKYPLIWLVMDFVEKCGVVEDGYCSLPDIQILIAKDTNAQDSTKDRIEKTFKPRLIPVYREFINQLTLSGYFFEQSESEVPHERILRPYWGGQDSIGNGQANLFNDFIDAIQIRRLQLRVNENVCNQFNL
jgi:hypothetical protein